MSNSIIAAIPIIASLLNGEIAKTAIVTSHVYAIDEISRQPITNASVKAWFEVDIGWRAWTESAPIVTAESTTDESGMCRLSGETNTGDIFLKAWKEGIYYDGLEHYKCLKKDNWQSNNNIITIALQRVEHPIPLFVKRIKGEISSTNDFFNQTNNKLAFDLMKGDWLPPIGSGSVADISFRRKLISDDVQRYVIYKGVKYLNVYEMTAVFDGDDNGLLSVNSERARGIRLRRAPERGYDMKEVVGFRASTGRIISSRDENKCFYFRIRTKRNEKGEIVSACYGKIYGDISLSDDTFSPEFLYYLNTTPLDRNLEWDMKNNLCPVETRTYPLEP